VSFGPEINPKRARPLPFVLAWAVMLVLAGISLWTAFSGLGRWAPVLQFGIAAIQTAILFILFMRLKGPPSLKWVFAVTGFFWLSFLYGLSMTDYANRRGWPPVPAQSEALHHDRQNGP
jgi:caa(3)-type oxidase subunit IV